MTTRNFLQGSRPVAVLFFALLAAVVLTPCFASHAIAASPDAVGRLAL